MLSELVLSDNLIHIDLDLGTSDKQIGNVDVLSNGGRLQPGCYSDENNVNECKNFFSSFLIFMQIKCNTIILSVVVIVVFLREYVL